MRTRKLSILFVIALVMAYGNAFATDDPGKPANISFQEIGNSTIFYGEQKIYPSHIGMDIITTYLKEFKKNPDTYIKITSHTSNEGDWENSLDISRKRAIAMAEHFRKHGVPQDRIILDWLGDDVPQFFNAADQHKNRRTNIRVIKKVQYSPNDAIAKEEIPTAILVSHSVPAKQETISIAKEKEITLPVASKKINELVEEKVVAVRKPIPPVKEAKVVAKPIIKTTEKEVVTTPIITKKETQVKKIAKKSPTEKTTRKVAKPTTTPVTIPSVKDELVAKGGQILPEKTIIFIDSSTKEALQVDVDMITHTGKISVSTSYKGELKIDLNTLKKDFIDIYAYGYFFKSAQIAFNENQQTIMLQPTDKGEKIELNNLQFVAGKAILLEGSNAELERLYLSLMMNPESKMEVGGHINVPKKSIHELSARQMQLSVDRAKSVYDFLIKKGVSKRRLTYKGYGNSEMIFPNPKNDKEKSRNRRVEVKIVD